jgi:small subunit ribosomal protein S4
LVSHGLFKLNGKRVTVPSIELQPEDTFEIIDRMKNMPLLASKKGKKEDLPSWVTFDFANLKGSITRDLVKEELPTDINAQLIVEYYSR